MLRCRPTRLVSLSFLALVLAAPFGADGADAQIPLESPLPVDPPSSMNTPWVVESALVVFFWGSPIIYNAHDRLLAGPGHDGWGYLYYLNPMAGILEAYRSVLYFGQPPNWDTLGIAVIVTLAVGAWGIRSFWVHEKRFADLI